MTEAESSPFMQAVINTISRQPSEVVSTPEALTARLREAWRNATNPARNGEARAGYAAEIARYVAILPETEMERIGAAYRNAVPTPRSNPDLGDSTDANVVNLIMNQQANRRARVVPGIETGPAPQVADNPPLPSSYEGVLPFSPLNTTPGARGRGAR